jgi:hypothetical protein
MSTADSTGGVAPAWRRWLGALALLSALVSVGTFLAFFSVSAQYSKALVYGGDLMTMLYLNAPTISTVAGVASVVMAIVAMWGSRRAMNAAISGFAIAVPVFIGLMYAAFSLMFSQPPAADVNFPSPPPTALLVTFKPTPPAIGMVGPLLVMGAVLLWRRTGVLSRRPAIAAFISGGMVAAYWILDFLIMSASSE